MTIFGRDHSPRINKCVIPVDSTSTHYHFFTRIHLTSDSILAVFHAVRNFCTWIDQNSRDLAHFPDEEILAIFEWIQVSNI